MLIDFNEVKKIAVPGINGGTGMMSYKIYRDKQRKLISSRIHVGGSIGMHKHDTSDDITYIIYGNGKAICNDREEILTPGCCHICEKGSSHSIINTGDTDLMMITVVVER